MIAVTFALPQESKGFRALLSAPGGSAGHISDAILGNLGQRELLVCHTGIGKKRAAKIIGEFLAMHQPNRLISAGFAGALDPALRVGDIVAATNFSDYGLLARVKAARPSDEQIFFGPLVTVDSVVETAEAKKELARRSGAVAVDMETSAIHEVCAGANVPMLSLRVISDAATQSLPVPYAVWFNARQQRPRPLALLRYLARHPSRIRPFTRFFQGVEHAGNELTRILEELVPAVDGN